MFFNEKNKVSMTKYNYLYLNSFIVENSVIPPPEACQSRKRNPPDSIISFKKCYFYKYNGGRGTLEGRDNYSKNRNKKADQPQKMLNNEQSSKKFKIAVWANIRI